MIRGDPDQMIQDIEQFDGNSNSGQVKLLQVYNQQGLPEFQVGVIAYSSMDEINKLRTLLRPCAEKGILVAIDGQTYKNMKLNTRDRQKARILIQPFNAHNDKLGFDFSNNTRKYVISESKQFQLSKYKDFCQSAAVFYKTANKPQASQHFENQTLLFNIPQQEMMSLINKQQVDRPLIKQRYDENYEAKISGLSNQLNEHKLEIQQLENEMQILDNQCAEQDNIIRGYNDKVILTPESVQQVPNKMRKMLTTITEQFQEDDHKQYVQSLLEPFHPKTYGTRVPMLIPRPTVTYNTMFEKTLMGSGGDVVVLNNFANQDVEQMLIMQSNVVVQNLLNNQGVELSASRNGISYNLTAVKLGTVAQFNQSLTAFGDSVINQSFVKSRTVAAGLRCFKVSSSDNEAGNLDMVYSRDGSSMDDGSKTLQTYLARPGLDRKRFYLSQATKESCRGRTGLISQANFRPCDDWAFKFAGDEGYNLASDRTELNFAGQTSPFWFIVDQSPATPRYVIHDYREIAVEPTDHIVHLATVTSQQRHSVMTVIRDMPSDMQISVEYIKHMEGIVDQDLQGFATSKMAQLRNYSSPLQLVANYQTETIFGDYAARRDAILTSLIQGHQVNGLWDETIFPGIKEIVSYGADTLLDSNTSKDVVNAAVDAAALALGQLVPSLLPSILGLQKSAKHVLQDKTQDMLKAVRQWAISGLHDETDQEQIQM